jgi:hypothetical protein
LTLLSFDFGLKELEATGLTKLALVDGYYEPKAVFVILPPFFYWDYLELVKSSLLEFS